MTSTVFLRELAAENVHVTASAGASTIVAEWFATLAELSESEQFTPVSPKPDGRLAVTV